jgi:hypothetical protein
MDWWSVGLLVAVVVAVFLGVRALGSYRPPAGRASSGALGSVLSIMDSTGVPTREEAAAAVEEQKQMRLEAYSAGPGTNDGDPYRGRVRIRAPRPQPQSEGEA